MNKDFYRFLSGFMGLVCVSLAFIFAIGFYETSIMKAAPTELNRDK